MSDDEALWPPREETVVPNPWKSRALKYEQALLEVRRMALHRPYRAADCHQRLSDILIAADLAMDKPIEGK